MRKNLTELVCILDKSGSMLGLEKDTVGGFNSMLKKQQAIKGECGVTTVLFDNRYELLHDRADIRGIAPITENDYCVGGSTALLDAMGKTISKIIGVQKNMGEKYGAGKVMFVIITDGEENSSREFTAPRVREMVEERKSRYGWEFVFLGANMDEVKTAGSFGISPDSSVDYVPDKVGTALNYRVMSEAVTSFRTRGCVPQEAFDDIKDDIKNRGERK